MTRSNKKYTNLTFKKRVDHEAGHAPAKRMKEPALCVKCGAVYGKGRWSLLEDAGAIIKKAKSKALEVTCPGCWKIENNDPGGFVYLIGRTYSNQKEAITNHLKNEENKMLRTNPLARIMDVSEGKNRVTIRTTTENLAQHLGRALAKAFGGKVRYDFSHENKLIRVYWEVAE